MASTEGKTRMVRLEPTSLLLAPSTVHMLPPRPLPLTDELDARHQAPVLGVEAVALADAGHERAELQEVAAVQGKLAHLLARDQARDLAADGLDRDAFGLDRDLSR